MIKHKTHLTVKQLTNGFSLVEMLVATVIFAILAVVGTQIVAVSLRNTNKGEKVTEVRENVDYAFNVIARELRNAESINVATSTDTAIQYTDADGIVSTIDCTGSSNGRLRVNGAVITGGDIVVDCNAAADVFTYQPATATSPYSITITVTAYDVRRLGIDGAGQTTTTRIIVRSF